MSLSFYPLLLTGWRKRGSEEGVIGAHALCIISYSEEDSAARGNELGRRCTEVKAANANEGAAFAGRYIRSRAHVTVNAAPRRNLQKHTESGGSTFGCAVD